MSVEFKRNFQYWINVNFSEFLSSFALTRDNNKETINTFKELKFKKNVWHFFLWSLSKYSSTFSAYFQLLSSMFLCCLPGFEWQFFFACESLQASESARNFNDVKTTIYRLLYFSWIFLLLKFIVLNQCHINFVLTLQFYKRKRLTLWDTKNSMKRKPKKVIGLH